MNKNTIKIVAGGAILTAGTVWFISSLRRKKTAPAVAGGITTAAGSGLALWGIIQARKEKRPLLTDNRPNVKLLSDSKVKPKEKVTVTKIPNKEKENKATPTRGIKIALKYLNENQSFSDNTKKAMNENLVKGIYAAEKKRLTLNEKASISSGIRLFDGQSLGYGQISNLAFEDVMKKYAADFQKYCREVGIPETTTLNQGFGNYLFEDFVVTYYLAICINNADIGGRTIEDMEKVAIGCYHGSKKTIIEIQEILRKEGKNDYLYSNIEEKLMQGTKKNKKLVEYINEVYNYSE